MTNPESVSRRQFLRNLQVPGEQRQLPAHTGTGCRCDCTGGVQRTR